MWDSRRMTNLLLAGIMALLAGLLYRPSLSLASSSHAAEAANAAATVPAPVAPAGNGLVPTNSQPPSEPLARCAVALEDIARELRGMNGALQAKR